jgi:Pyridoxal-phosphate dependent enzyme
MIARLRFAHLPTPIEALPRLSEALKGPQLLVKRDDETGLAFGGNKTRKLEFLLAEAQAKGARTLITAGALQSNHCRQTAAAAARFGFNCILVLVGEAPLQASANLLLDQLFGAEIVWAEKSRREAILQDTFEKATTQGKKPYLVPYGGSYRGTGLFICNGRIDAANIRRRPETPAMFPGLVNICLLLRRDAGRAGTRGADIRIPWQVTRNQCGRTTAQPAGACGETGHGNLRAAWTTDRICT